MIKISIGETQSGKAINPNENLVATTVSNSTIAISWTPTSSDYSHVEIERCTGAGCADFRAVFGSPFTGPRTSHSEAGLASGTTYHFRMRATTSTSESEWLTSQSITTETSSGPTGFTVTDTTDTTISFHGRITLPAKLFTK